MRVWQTKFARYLLLTTQHFCVVNSKSCTCAVPVTVLPRPCRRRVHNVTAVNTNDMLRWHIVYAFHACDVKYAKNGKTRWLDADEMLPRLAGWQG